MCRSADRTFCDPTGDDGEEMKTLAEVIKAFEICDETVTANCPDCPYDIDCENVPGEDLRTDALHYLREYQDMLEDPGKMVEYLRQASIQRSKDLEKERKRKK